MYIYIYIHTYIRIPCVHHKSPSVWTHCLGMFGENRGANSINRNAEMSIRAAKIKRGKQILRLPLML